MRNRRKTHYQAAFQLIDAHGLVKQITYRPIESTSAPGPVTLPDRSWRPDSLF